MFDYQAIKILEIAKVHIGKEIHKVYKQLRLGQAEMAKMISTTPQNVNSIFKRKSMDADQLLLISKALNFDFFELYSKELQDQFFKEGLQSAILTETKERQVSSELTRCQMECENLKKMLELQTNNQRMSQKYITLLEDKLEQVTGQRMDPSHTNNGD